MAVPSINILTGADGGRKVLLAGRWTLNMLAPLLDGLRPALAEQATVEGTTWNCLDIEALDSAGAILLWRAWQRRLPGLLLARPEQLRIFEHLEDTDHQPPAHQVPHSPFEAAITIGGGVLRFWHSLVDFITLVGQLLLVALHLLRHPRDTPWREISATLFKSGVLAMPVTALVGFLIGIVLSYLSSLQLKQFGADIYIVNILGLGIIRELGPVLVAVLVAGRSGSAMTAQLGVMRVTEEIEALATMGVSQSLRLVFPKVLALGVVMPLLVLWATAIALIGGMVSAQAQLDISYGFFFDTLPKAVPVVNVWIGLTKGLVFGILVALIACHYGLRVRPNTESLSSNTTTSVVTSITVVILVDAVFAIVTRQMGMPG
ncbi:MAG: ABC transporter permease [Rhodocyclaceae bacterium]|nr:MAG: ABC transporter permease [Rhodocyclaceae bacterium]